MARPLRILLENGIYHVISRGAGGRDLYLTDRDRNAYLARLEVARVKHQLQLLAYCLLQNHVHLLVRTPLANLPQAMHAINAPYAAGFLKRNETRGPVFERRYKDRLVQREGYLERLVHYVTTNALKHGFCARLEDWRWSSHHAVTGSAPAGPVAVGTLLGLLDEDPRRARERYAAIVTEPRFASFEPQGAIIGDDAFVRPTPRRRARQRRSTRPRGSRDARHCPNSARASRRRS
jgi:REP element-mobilizing transposase RayT